MSKLGDKVKKYVEVFEQSVPVFQLPDMSDEELIALIDEHIESGEPIVPDISDDPDILY